MFINKNYVTQHYGALSYSDKWHKERFYQSSYASIRSELIISCFYWFSYLQIFFLLKILDRIVSFSL